jgi:RNA polymerase sigma-70 factor (ECF subfamily)
MNGRPLRAVSAASPVTSADANWLREVYDDNHVVVYRYVLHLVSNPAMAEDFVSETFLRAAKSVDRLRDRRDSVRQWLFRVARNVVLDYRKSAYARKCVLIDYLPDVLTNPDRPDELVVKNWLVGEVDHCVQLLTASHRDCLQLRFRDGLSVRETAIRLNRTVNATKQLQHRALGKLGELLAGSADAADLIGAA